ncbi:MAG: serine/threonine protein kinase [Candidatus Obscuribacterales bacterium]|nr:serine/threonine protein kinase [Candidatus Obscuribacterales bacterium]
MSRPQIGKTFQDRYMIVSQLGTGGMGVVYRARQVDADRDVAIKLLNSESLDDESTARFYREFKLLSKFTHPNIVTVYGLALDDERRPYAISEFVEGSTLRTVLNEQGRLSWELSTSIIVQLCDALNAVHQEEIVHRDLKPENIMLVDKPHPFFVKLLDFGVARLVSAGQSSSQKLTWTGQLLGSPQYMSPEQVEGRVDPRSDIYAIGCIYFEMIAGEPLFEADTAVGLVFKQKSEDPTSRIRALNKTVPYKLRSILLKALAKKADDRYQSVLELAADLKDLQARPGGFEEHATASSSISFPRLPFIFGGIFLIGISVAGFFYIKETPSTRPQKEAKATDSMSATKLRSLLAQSRASPAQAERLKLLVEFARLSKNTPNVELHLLGLSDLVGNADPAEALPYIMEMKELLATSGQKLSQKSRQFWTVQTILRMVNHYVSVRDFDRALELINQNALYVRDNDEPNREGQVSLLATKAQAFIGLRDPSGVDSCVNELRNSLKEGGGFPGVGTAMVLVHAIYSDLKFNRSESKIKEHTEYFIELQEKTESYDVLNSFANECLTIAENLCRHSRIKESRVLAHKTRVLLDSREEMVRENPPLAGTYLRILTMEKIETPSMQKTALMKALEKDVFSRAESGAFPFACVKEMARALHHFDGQRAALAYLEKMKPFLAERDRREECATLNPSAYLMQEILDCLRFKLPDANRLAREKDFVISVAAQKTAECQLSSFRQLEYNMSPLLSARKFDEAKTLSWALLDAAVANKLIGSPAFTSILSTTTRIADDPVTKADRKQFLRLRDLLLSHMSSLNYQLGELDCANLAVSVHRTALGLCRFDMYDEPGALIQKAHDFFVVHKRMGEGVALPLMEASAETFGVPDAKKHIPDFKELLARFIKLSSNLSYSSECRDRFRSILSKLYRDFQHLELNLDAYAFYADMRKATETKSKDDPKVELALLDSYSDFVEKEPTKAPAVESIASDYLRALALFLKNDPPRDYEITTTVNRIANNILIPNKMNAQALAFLQDVRSEFKKAGLFGDANKLRWLVVDLEAARKTSSVDEAQAALKEMKALSVSGSELIKADALYEMAHDAIFAEQQYQRAVDLLRESTRIYEVEDGDDYDDHRYKSFVVLSTYLNKLGRSAESKRALLRALKAQEKFDPESNPVTELIAERMVHHFEETNEPTKAAACKTHNKAPHYLQKLLAS